MSGPTTPRAGRHRIVVAAVAIVLAYVVAMAAVNWIRAQVELALGWLIVLAVGAYVVWQLHLGKRAP